MKTDNSVRIQTSLLNPIEKKALLWMAPRLPKWVKSDHLTVLGFIGSLIIAAGYCLTNVSDAFLWLASFGFFVNWLGDSLDGTLARVRNTQRPVYGFYIDHNFDCLCEFFMVGGAGLMPYMHMWSSLLIVVPYLMLEVYVMINAHLKSEFKLTYSKLGPTELRLIIMIVNTLVFFCPFMREAVVENYEVFAGQPITIYALDIFGVSVSAILFVIYLCSFYSDARYFAKLDPLKKH